MQKKLKFQRFMILVLAFVIVLILVSIMTGRVSKVEIVMVEKVGLDTTKTIEQQRDFFRPQKISKDAFEAFGGNVLLYSDLEQVKTQKPKFSFVENTPVIKSLLTSENVGGPKAANIGLYHTIQKLPGVIPPGAVAGDRIDIVLLYQKDGAKGQTSGILLRNVLLDSAAPEGAYVSVSQKDALKLTIAQNLGTFVLQLPGTKLTNLCTAEELENRNKENIECYVPEDDLTDIDAESILEELNQKENQITPVNPGQDLANK